ncbi:TPA: phage antirepressor N-terminal domain-containing protein [Pluralibacter gergoviae]|nr:phage antirepressor N-terminal domain-containing protein [Pluralibacter gergoviae]
MTSLAIADRTINVPFYGNSLFVVEHKGEDYTPMRPIIEGMGMDWASQFTKLKQRFKSTVVEITMVAADGKSRSMICLALRKLAAWLNSVSPNKVRPEIRDNVIRYQEEYDDVLYEYWTKGEVKKDSKHRKSTATQLIPLRQTAERLITTGLGKIYPDIWKLVHQRFDIEHIHQLEPVQIGEAVEYLNALEGEYIARERRQANQLDYQMNVHNINAACIHLDFIHRVWVEELRPALKKMESPMAGRLNDRITDACAIVTSVKCSLERASGLKGLQYHR